MDLVLRLAAQVLPLNHPRIKTEHAVTVRDVPVGLATSDRR